MQQQISKLTQVMLKHKVSQEVEAYKFLHMMAEVRWLLQIYNQELVGDEDKNQA